MKLLRRKNAFGVGRFFRKFRTNGSVAFFGLLLVLLASQAFANQGRTYVLGQIGDKSVAEGELVDFALEPPADFGPDVTWTVSGVPAQANFYEVPAFPGAEGFGVATSGGRGGRVVKVTNLNRSGEGSLAAALALEEPRIIVFDVSGVIEGNLPKGEWLTNKSARIYSANAPVTIAAQTAPGAGVTISGQLALTDGDGGEATDNAIVRFLRARSPYFRSNAGDSFLAQGNQIVFDHVSGAWGNDEVFDFSQVKRASIQWCGVEESAGEKEEWEVYTDRDADGMLDFWEKWVRDFCTTDSVTDYILHIKPEGDLDGDGLTNLEEFENGSNPLESGACPEPAWTPDYDSDGDGMADWWELKAINLYDDDNLESLDDVRPEEDLDGDLSTNLEEYKAGTTPLAAPIHNFGMIMGYGGRDISLHHNFFAHHRRRAPLTKLEPLDYRNNVVYNTDFALIWGPLERNLLRPGELFQTNMIGNFFKPGPNCPKTLDISKYFYPFIGSGDSIIYSQGNYFDMIDEPSGYLDFFAPGRRKGLFDGGEEYRADEVFPAPDVETQGAEEAYGLVLAHAGALPRDAVTRRNIQEIRTGTGKWGKQMPEWGLMEGLVPAEAPVDSDDDGMPDAWETALISMPDGRQVDRSMLLDPSDGEDYNRIVKSGESVLTYEGIAVPGTEDRYKGYTYIEYYINELADRLVLESLMEEGYDASYLPAYGQVPSPGFVWTPDYDQVGTYDLVFTATDGDKTVSETVRFNVSDRNRKPAIFASMYKEDGTSISHHLTNTVEVGMKLWFEFYVWEIDGDEYTVEVSGAPEGTKITSTGRTEYLKAADYDVYTYEWIPSIESVGWSGLVTITASDGKGGECTSEFTLEVVESPVALHTVSIEAGEGGSVSPSGEFLIQDGEDIMLFFHPDSEYTVSGVSVDGVSLDAQDIGSYLLSDITADHQIQVSFSYSPETVSGVVLKLDFDGAFNDSSGLGNHGVASEDSSPVSVEDRFGNASGAMMFDGEDDFVLVEDSPYFDLTEYTATVWVYGLKDYYQSQYFLSKNFKDGSDAIGLFTIWNSLYTSGSGYPHIECLADLENQWIHLGVVRRADIAEFYLNGEFLGTAQTDVLEDNEMPFIVGARSNYDTPEVSFFHGAMDDLRLFSRALSATEMARLVETSGGGGHEGADDPDETAPEPAEPLSVIEGDVNLDGVVDACDLVDIVDAMNTTSADFAWNPQADLDESGLIDTADMEISLGKVGTCADSGSDPVHTITVAAGPGGSVYPNGGATVADGGSRTFLISPENGYVIEEVVVDGVSEGPTADFSYCFEDVTCDHEIQVSFARCPEHMDDLVLRLDFDGDLLDSSGLGNHGDSYGENMPELTVDRFGRADSACYFDGLDDFIRVEDSSDFDTYEFSVSAWVFGTQGFYTAQYLVSKNHTDSLSAMGMFALRNRLYSCGSGYPNTASLLGEMDSRWMHVAMVRSQSSVEFFIDGQSVGVSPAGDLVLNTLDLLIGARSRGDVAPNYAFFQGVLDDIRIYNRPLGAEDVLDLAKVSGDVNLDDQVDSADLLLLAAAYGSCEGSVDWNPDADLDCDGQVDMGDLVRLAANLGVSLE